MPRIAKRILICWSIFQIVLLLVWSKVFFIFVQCLNSDVRSNLWCFIRQKDPSGNNNSQWSDQIVLWADMLVVQLERDIHATGNSHVEESHFFRSRDFRNWSAIWKLYDSKAIKDAEPCNALASWSFLSPLEVVKKILSIPRDDKCVDKFPNDPYQ